MAPAAHTSWSIWGTAPWGCPRNTALVDIPVKGQVWSLLQGPGGLVDAGLPLIYLGPERLNGGMGTGSGQVAGEKKGKEVEWVGMPRQ